MFYSVSIPVVSMYFQSTDLDLQCFLKRRNQGSAGQGFILFLKLDPNQLGSSKVSRSGSTLFIHLHDETILYRERSGSVVECLTQDRGAAGSSFTGVTALCP